MNMTRKDDAPKDEAMDGAQRRGRRGVRPFLVAGLTVGVMAAAAGGVIAGVSTPRHSGNAATAQYGSNCAAGSANSFSCNAPPQSPGGGVLGSKTSKEKTSKRRIKIHIKLPRGAKLTKVTVKVNGKVFSVFQGKQVSANIRLANLPCGKGATTVVVIAVMNSGKTVRQTHKYHLC
jgi:hypothetical protein